jgi:hypothetical protein
MVSDIDTPQKEAVNDDDPEWLWNSCALNDDDEARVVAAEADAISAAQNSSRLRLIDHLVTGRHAGDYDWGDELRPEISLELWLSLKKRFVGCPYCVIRDNWMSPVREGQFLCSRPQCWQIVPWRNAGGVEAIGVTASNERTT